MATFAIAAAIVVLAAWLILGGITVAGYLLAARDADKPGPPPPSVDEHFKTAPREQRIDEAEVDRLVEAFDWPRYATWLKEPS